jgi:uncharacterized repeat protein (TIGR01451 family)
MKKIRNYLACLVATIASITLPAAAIQSPTGCNSNRLSLSITRDKLTVQNGDTLTYTVTLSNVDAGASIACDIDNATVAVILPAFDGTPTGQTVTLTTNGSYPAGTAFGVVGTVPYTVNVGSSVTDATAEATVNGTLHDAPTDHAATISKTIGTTVVHPATSTSTGTSSTTASLPGMPNTAIAPKDNED